MQGKWFIPVYRLGEDGDLKNEGDGMLSVWALRARSYKTEAEAQQQGVALHPLQGVYFVFVLLPVRGFKGSKVQWFKRFGSVLSVLSVKSVVKDKCCPWWNRLELLWILDGT